MSDSVVPGAQRIATSASALAQVGASDADVGAAREPWEGPGVPEAGSRRVLPDAAPLLGAPDAGVRPRALVRRGELLLVRARLAPLEWRGHLDGESFERSGPMLAVQRAAGDATLFAFAADLGPDEAAPSVERMCAEAAKASPDAQLRNGSAGCPALLRRLVTSDGAAAGYEPCAQGPCSVILFGPHGARTIWLDGIVDGRPLELDGKTVLLVTKRWAHDDGAWTGGALASVSLAPTGPAAVSEVPLDEVDARDPRQVTSRVGVVSHTANRVTFVGTHHTVDRATGRNVASAAIDERYVLGPDATLVRTRE